MITAKTIEDSISPDGIRLTTMHLRYPRIIHSELMTHRVFSRNARSSRAVPNRVLLAETPYEPIRYGSNRPGMSAGDELPPVRRALARLVWHTMIGFTRIGVRLLGAIGLHKQWSNRPLEWFGYIDVLVTSTDWNNWFALRRHSAAQPEIKALADAMIDVLNDSVPKHLKPGEWHLPYVLNDERREFSIEDQRRLSVARCARISYAPFDGDARVSREFHRHDELITHRPMHASPAEHQATPDSLVRKDPISPSYNWKWHNADQHGNFRGWRQYRKMLQNEAVRG